MKIVYFMVTVSILLRTVRGYSFESLFQSYLVICNHDRTLNLGVARMQIYFYDFKHNFSAIYPISSASENIASYGHFDPTRRLAVHMPDFASDLEAKDTVLIREAYKNLPDIYLVIVDYSAYTAKKLTAEALEEAVPYAYYIGRGAGIFLAEIHAKGIPSKSIHVSGHKYGGHIIGFIGEAYTVQTSEKLWRITSISPLEACFFDAENEDRIRPGVAEYVEIYHCFFNFATTLYLGDVDFFFNMERGFHPGCSEGFYIDMTGTFSDENCDHKFCVKYWTDSFQDSKRYEACRPAYYDEGECTDGERTVAGYHNPGDATGVFYASTKLREHNSNTKTEF